MPPADGPHPCFSCSALQALAKAAAATNAPLAKALAAEVAKRPHASQVALIETHFAASMAAFGCMLAATELGWHGTERGRAVSGAAALIFGSGQGVLNLQVQYTAVTDATDGVLSPNACNTLWNSALLQLMLLRSAAQAAAPSGQGMPARLAAKLATPEQLLSWLSTLSMHIVTAHRGLPEGETPSGLDTH